MCRSLLCSSRGKLVGAQVQRTLVRGSLSDARIPCDDVQDNSGTEPWELGDL